VGGYNDAQTGDYREPVRNGAANGYGHDPDHRDIGYGQDHQTADAAGQQSESSPGDGSTQRPLWGADSTPQDHSSRNVNVEQFHSRRPSGNPGTESSSAASHGARAGEGMLRDVIGAPDGEHVTLAAALAQPERYWVDPDTQAIWDLSYRRALFGEESRYAA